jgi:hypothetical protein
VLNRGTATIGGASADLLTIDLTGVNLFVGVGAGFSGDTTALVTGNATGFLTTSANLSVAMAKSTATADTRRWTGIAASAASMSVVGLPTEFTVEVKDLSVKYNAASGAAVGGNAGGPIVVQGSNTSITENSGILS